MTDVHLPRREKSWGDRAVDGLLAGLVGGLIMILFLILAGWAGGIPPRQTAGYFDPAFGDNWFTGLLAHLAVSALYGAVFGLLLRIAGWLLPLAGRYGWLWGVLYGLLLWGLAVLVLFRTTASPLTHIPAWEFGLSHLLYGLALGVRLASNRLGE